MKKSEGERPANVGVSGVGSRLRDAGVVVPRAWLAALTVLVVLPWVALGVWYVSTRRVPVLQEAVPGNPPLARTSGPWGLLRVTPIVISPPLEFVPVTEVSAGPIEWRFPATDVETAGAFLRSAGLAPDVVAGLLRGAAVDARTKGLILRPSPELVRQLTPEVRGRLYSQLARTPLNPDQAHAYRFPGDSTDRWLGSSSIAPATRALVEPFIYRFGGLLYFADLRLVQPQIDDVEEERRLIKVLLRQQTLRVEVSLPNASSIQTAVEYWGRGGRRTDIRPLLESVGPDGWIDIIHLLPSFVRERLYRYPKLTAPDLERPVIANCLWTALNFFEAEPDDRFLDVPYAIERLKTDYFVVESQFQLGDIFAFLDRQDTLFHAAVYLADDLLFTKNGTTPMAPWMIASLEDLKAFYRTRAENPRVIVHRRKDL